MRLLVRLRGRLVTLAGWTAPVLLAGCLGTSTIQTTGDGAAGGDAAADGGVTGEGGAADAGAGDGGNGDGAPADAGPGGDASGDAGGPSSVAVYPGLDGDLYKSPKYAVTVASAGGAEQSSYVYETVNTNNAGLYGLFQNANHWTSFSFTGAVSVKVTVLDRATISAAVLRPGSRQLTGLSGNTVTFGLDAPGNFYVEIDDDLDLDPLFVFANPPEADAPSPSDPNVIVLQPDTHDPGAVWQGARTVAYFAPGVHDLGTAAPLSVPAGHQVYLAGGAYVKGLLYLEAGTGTVVNGRGVLSGRAYPESGSWGYLAMIDGLRWGQQMGVTVEGLTFADGPGIQIFVEGNDQSTVVVDNVKCMAWYSQTDGIGGAPGTIVRNSFLKVYDDMLHLTRQDVRLYDNVVWLQGQGSAIQLGWNATDSTTSNHVDGLYVIHDNLHTSGRDDDHGNDNIVSLREIHGGATRSGLVFENVFQEGGNLYQAFGIRINDPWQGAPYGVGDGSLAGITFRNVHLEGLPRYRSVFSGVGSVAGTSISNVSFEDVSIDGQPLTAGNAGTYLDVQAQCSGFTYAN
jgi:hypothetical protein